MTSITAGQVAVLLNRTAGRGRSQEHIPAVLDALRAGGRPVTPMAAETEDEARQACQEAVDGGASAIVAVGGDGTVHLALQAVAGTGVPFGAVPAGTGNDFCADLGLPDSPVAAAGQVAEALRDGRTRPLDLARMTNAAGEVRWFGAVLAAGFDAIVNERANRMRFPRGPRRYDIAIALELLRLRPRHYRLVLDGTVHEVDSVLIAVGNTASYGGGMKIAPAADPTDGLLDIVVAAPLGRLTLIGLRPHLAKGTHVDNPLVSTYRAATVEMSAEGITGYADGERAFELPVTITAAPGALTLLS